MIPPAPDFAPPRGLRNPHLQSILASHRLRRWLRSRELADLERDSEALVIDCGDGVRLQAFHTPAIGDPRGLAVLLHGWEGSARSTYLGNTAVALRGAGFSIFRLEFRDHGDGQHLNEGLFHSCRIGEVVGGVQAAAQRWPDLPLLLAGFSLGGNFALRVALRAPAAGIALRQVVAICPAIHPGHVLEAMEAAPFFYRQHFLIKWRRSLQRKQAAFPQLYDFAGWTRGLGIRALTRELIIRNSEFPTLDDYLDGYSIAGNRLAGLQVPTAIVTAEDDPIIPVADFRNLELPSNVRLDILRHGGHCGFLENWRLHSWAERYVLNAFVDATGEIHP